MSDTETNPDTGVDGQGDAQNDDIDTELFDRAEAPADDDDPEPAEGDLDGDDDEDTPASAVEMVEVEDETGQRVKVPANLKDAFLRQRDYTIKTQALGLDRQALTKEAEALAASREQQADAFKALQTDYVKVAQLETNQAALTSQAATYRNVDWAVLQQQDPAGYEKHRAIQRQVRDALVDIDDELKGAKSELSTKETARVDEAAKAAAADLAKRQATTGEALRAAIPNWGPEETQKTIAFMVSDLGVDIEEVAEATDPRLWKMAHELMTLRTKVAGYAKRETQKKIADGHAKAQTATPAPRVKGSQTSVRDPSTPRGDNLSTSEWMRRRNAQEAAKRRA